ncbi:DUF2796 domain-containing protein [Ascidiaceihabitans sp.]|nr:DUF2796 domain-containing protein [Ascidiaceihabitans sp.]MDA9135634.1 DUF2796 domain-containing protein [Ascidiaceihabitans sp.]
MKVLPFLIATAITATPVIAEETRQLDAHEHGVGQLNIAIEGQQIAMELHAPGADIVGFEYAAESAKDLAAVDAAVAKLSAPLALFVLPEAAGCSIVEASAGLESEEEHEEHGDEHADDEHAEDEHEDHGHDEDGHDEDGHDDHADESGHTEFHAEYLLNCAEPSAITGINFAYFGSFPNALEVEVQIIIDTGATSFEVERDAPTLDLTGLF